MNLSKLMSQSEKKGENIFVIKSLIRTKSTEETLDEGYQRKRARVIVVIFFIAKCSNAHGCFIGKKRNYDNCRKLQVSTRKQT